MKLSKLIIAGGIAAAGFAGTSQAVVIDEFNIGNQGPFFGGYAAQPGLDRGSENNPGITAIGGERDIFVANTTGGVPTLVNTGVPAAGDYGHSQGVGGFGYSLVTYDGIDSTPAIGLLGTPVNVGGDAIDATVGLGGIDLLADGSQLSFEVTDVEPDNPNANILIYVFSSPTAYSTLTVDLSTAIDGDIFSLDATNFVQGTVATLLDGVTTPMFLPTTAATQVADFSNVTAIGFLVDGSIEEGLDVAVNFFQAGAAAPVPVPASLLMLGLGLAGFKLRRLKAKAG